MQDKKARRCVRVIITKGRFVCIIEHRSRTTGEVSCISVPGGGVEEGRTEEQTATLECLEEVGIQIKDISYTGIEEIRPSPFFNKKGILTHNATHDRYYVAGYEKNDNSLFNTEGDGFEYIWLTPEEAIQKIKEGPRSPANAKCIEALAYADKLITKRIKGLFYRW